MQNPLAVHPALCEGGGQVHHRTITEGKHLVCRASDCIPENPASLNGHTWDSSDPTGLQDYTHTCTSIHTNVNSQCSYLLVLSEYESILADQPL